MNYYDHNTVPDVPDVSLVPHYSSDGGALIKITANIIQEVSYTVSYITG